MPRKANARQVPRVAARSKKVLLQTLVPPAVGARVAELAGGQGMSISGWLRWIIMRKVGAAARKARP